MEKLTLNYFGCDSWDRPLYKDKDGKIFVDVSPLSRCEPEICTKYNNQPEGEPDTLISVMESYKGVDVEFVPQRAVWR